MGEMEIGGKIEIHAMVFVSCPNLFLVLQQHKKYHNSVSV